MNDMNDITDYSEISREGLIDMLEEATERMKAAETRNKELEAALAGQHETVCAYCQQVFKSEDHDAILEHIKTCDKRPERTILKRAFDIEKLHRERIEQLIDAIMKVLDTHKHDEDMAVHGKDEKTPVYNVPNTFARDVSIAELQILMISGPDKRLVKSASEEALDDIALLLDAPEWEYPGQIVRDVAKAIGMSYEAMAEKLRERDEQIQTSQETE